MNTKRNYVKISVAVGTFVKSSATVAGRIRVNSARFSFTGKVASGWCRRCCCGGCGWSGNSGDARRVVNPIDKVTDTRANVWFLGNRTTRVTNPGHTHYRVSVPIGIVKIHRSPIIALKCNKVHN
jgi:hypothetical protein